MCKGTKKLRNNQIFPVYLIKRTENLTNLLPNS